MSLQEDKFVRFQDWTSEKSSRRRSQISTRDEQYPDNPTTETSSIRERFRKYFQWGTGGFNSITRSFNFHSFSDAHVTDTKSGKKILDPQGSFLQRWNKIFALSCVIAVYLDPLFFYIPVVDRKKNCLYLDEKLQITACVLRSFTDIFYILHIIFQFRTAFIAPSSRVFGRGVLVEDLGAIAKRYLSSYFLIDVLAVLPLPQVVILIIVPELSGSVALNTKNVLRAVIFFQYFPRLYRMYPLYREVTRNSGIITQTAWAGAAFNLLLYMLASHIFGATWYFFAIEREDMCWRAACKRASDCNFAKLYCGSSSVVGGNQFLNASCPILEPDKAKFDFGIYLDVLQSRVVESTDFPQKLFYCLWWGLRSLSSLGQNLATSTYVGEIVFAVSISIFGLVLFSLLIGNMQTYLQSNTVRLEEMRIKRRDAEQWMSHRLLPEDLRERIRRYEQYRWQETRGVDEEYLLRNLPKDLRRDIKRHLCLALLMRVRIFASLDSCRFLYNVIFPGQKLSEGFSHISCLDQSVKP
ncbi:Cyclic nucleotide-gated ion channel [Thalictrum thalictroides]|uniref:Cyclic nucleotide-gated ion channel n=1 Tax=Thalictrum thalictroides TaxID=46969 RepID=A0A7J6WTE5_THATH|nr:Cyclic nucleotide-gated ion channel [Thalictrum thalictroides]